LSPFAFTSIAGEPAGKGERLFCAVVEAYCSLTRPTQRDAARLDDLAMPLIEGVSEHTLRYAAAALSECPVAPAALVRHLCNLPTAICAPLLLRTAALGDIDLLTLIGRHGLAHARIIGGRPNLNPRIAQLVTALLGASGDAPRAVEPATPSHPSQPSASSPTLEQTRDSLRAMMRPAAPLLRWREAPDAFQRLRSTAFTGVPGLFRTALADLLELEMSAAAAICDPSDPARLAVALRAAGLTGEQAFMICVCVHGLATPHPEAVRLFSERYEALRVEHCTAAVGNWRVNRATVAPEQPAYLPAANASDPTRLLKAS
jgi:uncharacterized protein (DUF2336 family)